MARSLQYISIFCILFFLAVLVPYLPAHEFDMSCWEGWAKFIKEHGLRNVYQSTTDYPPLLHYGLWPFAKLANSPEAITANIKFVKSVVLIFDFVGLWYMYRWLQQKTQLLVLVIFCLLNIGYMYDTIIWGQLDGVLATLVFISFYYGYKHNMLLSGLFMILALNFKIQAVVLLPLWCLLYLNALLVKRNAATFILPIVGMALLQVCILLPFIQAGALQDIYRVTVGSVGRYPYVGLWSANFWNFFLGGHTEWVPDSWFWMGKITYKQGGLFLFFTTSALVLLPFFIRIIRQARQRENEQLRITREQLWLTAGLIVLLFYFFNTQMHDRYAQPAFIFIAAYSFYARRAFPFVVFSLAQFLCLEDALHAFKFSNYSTLIFDEVFIAGLYLIVIIYLAIRLFKAYRHTELHTENTW